MSKYKSVVILKHLLAWLVGLFILSHIQQIQQPFVMFVFKVYFTLFMELSYVQIEHPNWLYSSSEE